MSEVMTPTGANFLGKVFGGTILSLLDLVAYATSSRYAGAISVTASFDRVDFHEPIEVGEIVSCEGFVSYVGRTSMEITIEAHAENVFTGVRRHTNTARVTMVAIKDNKPVEVPRLICETTEDKIRFLEGKLRREMRGLQRQEFDKLAAGFRTAESDELDRLIASDRLLNMGTKS
jgi:acyl-CoA hydrolase